MRIRIVHASGNSLRAVAHGWWKTPAGQDIALRVKRIHDEVAALIAEHEPEAVAIEESYVGADARIALSVGQARGAVLVACAAADVPCREYSPATVKQTVCGYGRADKAQVQGWCGQFSALRMPRSRTTPPTLSPWRSAMRSSRRSPA